MLNNYLTVSALNQYIKTKIDSDPTLFRVFLKGEISNFKRHQKGHLYFTLKDETSQISAVMFASNKPSIELKDGMKVLLVGRVRVYDVTGTYQVYVDAIKNDGIGDLYAKFDALKKELFLQGYFNEEHKKKLPKFPKRIGVVTSKTGAVIEDITNVIKKRYPLVEIILYSSLVQGEKAKEEIVKQINKANKEEKVDVLIVGRGGGSIEDLWAFNEKEVAIATYESKIPIISAVGHETDYTIIDFVSDARAETPTSAAVMATPNMMDIFSRIEELKEKAFLNFSRCLSLKNIMLENISKKISYNSPKNKLNMFYERYNVICGKLKLNMRLLIENKLNYLEKLNMCLNNDFYSIYANKKNMFDVSVANLKNLNPLCIMQKGYSIVYKEGEAITSKEKLVENDEIKIRMYDGEVKAIIK